MLVVGNVDRFVVLASRRAEGRPRGAAVTRESPYCITTLIYVIIIFYLFISYSTVNCFHCTVLYLNEVCDVIAGPSTERRRVFLHFTLRYTSVGAFSAK